jgi:hypothetical protein
MVRPMGALGLILQLVGTCIAAGALALEWFSESELSPTVMRPQPRRRDNPWRRSLNAKMAHDPRFRETSMAGPPYRSIAPSSPGADPEVLAFAEFMVERLVEREKLLARDWEEQFELDVQTRTELVRLFNEQSHLLRESRDRTRRRVTAEMFGLVLVAVGTLLGSLYAR